jgi:cobalt-zinc-cadmium efflux system protein
MTQIKSNTKPLIFDFVINTALTIIELVTGSTSGSAALLADGFQNLTDSLVLAIAFFTERFTHKRAIRHAEKVRVSQLSGHANAVILIVLSFYIAINSTVRILHPNSINTTVVMFVGVLSIFINWVAAGVLYGVRNDKNIRAPYIGLLFSGLSGCSVFFAGFGTRYFHMHHLDGVIGLFIAVSLFVRSVKLLRASLRGI